MAGKCVLRSGGKWAAQKEKGVQIELEPGRASLGPSPGVHTGRGGVQGPSSLWEVGVSV